ncbi:serine hydrolase domain-containing protein [Corynebacterium kalidii]|uniref:Beta-lactamase family protein n=1 Tax=Corynebacterium kalidii TaxID=2931982 RepID=A0A9X1WJZ4_9CORY|nr:serine hydrolase domain-containing protein [Corynebacterium kalidii]MCJ7858952.1 beta-lactamase family protein [Corynebacterium kalidii]
MSVRKLLSVVVRVFAAVLAVAVASQLWAVSAYAALREEEPAGHPSEEQFGVALADAVEAAGVPGATAAVVTPSSLDVHAVGEDAAGDTLRPDAEMLWGSVSKPIAATTVMKLVERGRIVLDDPVFEYLPEMPMTDPRFRSITIRQLLNHTSGLPFGADYLDVDDPDRRAVDVIAELRDLELIDDPGSRYAYSSLGYVLVQALIEEVEGEGLAEVESRLFPGLGVLDEVSPGARFVGNRAVPWRTPRDGAGLGYGYQGGTVSALAAVVQEFFGDRGAEVLDEMTREPVDSGGGELMGLGWRVRDDGVVWHTGTVPGYFSAVHVDRDQQVAVVVTMNASGVLHEEQLFGITSQLFDEATGIEGSVSANRGSPVGLLILLGVVVAVVALTVLGLLLRGGRRGALMWMGGSLVVCFCGWWVVPALLEVPARYIWLWIPELGIAFTLIPVTLFGVGVWWAFQPRRRRRNEVS